MADSKITALTALSGAGLASADVFGLVDVSDITMDASGTNKKMSAAELALGIQALGFTVSSNFLTADVTLSTTSAYFDGPSLTLAAGTYVLLGQVTLLAASTATRTWQWKLWDGTTIVTQGVKVVEGTAGTAQDARPIFGVVTPASSTTYKISALSNVGTADKIAHNAQKGSFLYAVKIG